MFRWKHIVPALALLLFIVGSVLKTGEHFEVNRYVAMGMDLDDKDVPIGLTYIELRGFVLQIGTLTLLHILLLACLIPSSGPARRWDHFNREEIRILPVTPEQVMIARFELTFFEISGFLVCMWVALLTFPARYLGQGVFGRTPMFASSTIEQEICIVSFTIFAFTFWLSRIKLFLASCGFRKAKLWLLIPVLIVPITYVVSSRVYFVHFLIWNLTFIAAATSMKPYILTGGHD